MTIRKFLIFIPIAGGSRRESRWNEFFADGEPGQFGHVGHLHFFEDVIFMGFHGLGAQPQQASHRLDALSLGQKRKDFRFTDGQRSSNRELSAALANEISFNSEELVFRSFTTEFISRGLVQFFGDRFM